MKTNDTVQQIKKKLELVQAVSDYIRLEKNGLRYTGLCPFHHNTNTPAFTVYSDQQSWWCFGCNKGGDVIDFLVEIEDISFGEFIKKYARKLGIVIANLSPAERQRFSYHKKLYAILEEARDLYHFNLLWDPGAARARTYLKHRGITLETLTAFGIGYAPDNWAWLYDQLKKKGYDEKAIITAGLAKKRKNADGSYDYFRNRIMFPIQSNGSVKGFGGRTMGKKKDGVKYINSPNTPVFYKSRSLYGLSQAKKAIEERNSVVIVEGYMDVLGLYQAGFRNTVGIMGVVLTRQQGELLSKHVTRSIMALDPDEAAEIAVERLRTERQVDLDLYIASIPGKKDPDEIVLEDPGIWEEILQDAKPIPIYMTDHLIERLSPVDPKERRDVANMVMPLIDIVKDPYEQAAYQEYLAKALDYDTFTPNPRCPHCKEKYHGEHNDK